MTNGQKRRSKKEDRGAGLVVAVLDHGTGNARITHDNLALPELLAVVELLQGYVGRMAEVAREEAIREKVKKELERERSLVKEEAGV